MRVGPAALRSNLEALESAIVDRLGGAWVRVVLLAIYAAVVLIRVPKLLYPGRFWAEQGAVYFHNAFVLPTGRFFTTPDLGYYSLFDKLTSWVAAHFVPLEWAPSLLAVFAFLVQSLTAVLILTQKLPGLESVKRQALALTLLAFVLPTNEVWLNTINSQFHFCVAAAILLVTRTEVRWVHWTRMAILLMAGMTGGPTLFLLPLFAARALQARDRRTFQEAFVLALACIVQGAIVWYGEDRGLGVHLHLLGPILFVKQFLLPIVGGHKAQNFGEWLMQSEYPRFGLWNLLFLLPHLAIALLLRTYGARREAFFLYVASLVVVLGSFVFQYHSSVADEIRLGVYAEASGRYYYAPNVLLWLAVLLSPRRETEPIHRRHWARIAAVVPLAFVLYTGARYYGKVGHYAWFFQGPDWRVEAARWRAGERSLRIWPEPWFMDLPHEGRSGDETPQH